MNLSKLKQLIKTPLKKAVKKLPARWQVGLAAVYTQVNNFRNMVNYRRARKYLLANYSDVFNEFDSENYPAPDEAAACEAYPVWVIWWQGEEHMPPLVKMCYRSVQRNAAGHPVILVTKDNFTRYVTVPDYIDAKVKNGTITLTNFSDILRAALLFHHGGLY